MSHIADTKHILIFGGGRSGIGAAKLAKNLGLKALLIDNQATASLADTMRSFQGEDIVVALGRNPTSNDLTNCELIVLSPGIPADLPILDEARAQKIPVISEIEFASLHTQATILAITGSNGKTTTASLLHHIINGYYNSHLLGNVGISFAEMAGSLQPDEYVVLELSSFQLETIDTFKPSVACLLNITPDHLNRHYNMENYERIKKRIFMNQDTTDYAVINGDDSYIDDLDIQSQLIYFSFHPLRPHQKGLFIDNGDIIKQWKPSQSKPLLSVADIPMLGKHNVENTMAAMAMALLIHIPLDIIVKQVLSFQGVGHRIEFVCDIKGISFYNDSKATNPDAAIKALESMDRPIILIAGGESKGVSFDSWAALFNDKVKELIVIGSATDEIIQAATKNHFTYIHRETNIETATKRALSLGKRGDVILLSPACTSYDQFENFEARGDAFKAAISKLQLGKE